MNVFMRKKEVFNKIIENSKIYFCYLMILIVSFGQFFRYKITSDLVPFYKLEQVYNVKISWIGLRMNGPAYYMIMYLGRLCEKFGFDDNFHQCLFQIICMILYAMAAFLLHKVFCQYVHFNKMFLFVAITLAFVNPLIVEHYVYHSILQALGIMFVASMIFCLSRKRYIGTIIFSYLAQNCYQTNVFVCVILSVSLAYFYLTDSGITLKNVLVQMKNVIVSVIGSILYFIQYTMNVVENGAISEAKDPTNIGVATETIVNGEQHTVTAFERVMKVYKYVFSKDFYYMQSNVFKYYVIAIIILVVICLLFQKNKIKRIVLWICYSVGLTIIPFMFWYVTGYDAVARILVPVFFSFAFLTMGFLEEITRFDQKFIIGSGKVICLIFVLIILVKTGDFVTETFMVQAEDEYTMDIIHTKIKDYEASTGIQIEEIAVTGRGGVRPYYDQQWYEIYGYNHKIYYNTWSQVDYFNLICNTDYMSRVMTQDEYDMCFKGRDINGIDLDKQVVIVGTTLYWYIR